MCVRYGEFHGWNYIKSDLNQTPLGGESCLEGTFSAGAYTMQIKRMLLYNLTFRDIKIDREIVCKFKFVYF